ncbi:MAG: hypothetical protein JNM13_14765 [Hyphomicrobiaceae bacterium]|nr:hypothetical protein [Hyphomicrobiaceae bacterium]
MKASIVVPNMYWLKDSESHLEVSAFYNNLFAALLELKCELAVESIVPVAVTGLLDDGNDGICYSYHARQPGRNTYCVKGAAIPGLWFIDRDGYSGWSQIANDAAVRRLGLDFPLDRAEPVIARVRDRFLQENFSKYAQSDEPLDPATAALPPFVFYPLQVNSDEVMKLARLTQVETIRALARLAEAGKAHVVIKRHPKCASEHIAQELEAAARTGFVTVSDASVHRLIPRCHAVVVANSGVGLEALIHGKPVFSFAASEYAHMTTPLRSLDELRLAFEPQPDTQSETIRRQLGFLLAAYFVDGSDAAAVAARVRQTIAECEAAGVGAGDAGAQVTDQLVRRASALHAIDKLLYDSVDYMLAVFDQMPEETQERMSVLLARAASRIPDPERILRRADERTLFKFIARSLKDKDLALAERVARQAVARNRSSGALYLLAKVLLTKGDKQEGLALAEESAAANDPSVEALVFIGNRRLTVKPIDASKALAHARKARERQPDYARAHWLEARALLLLSGPEAALPAASRAVELAPTIGEFRLLLDSIAGRRAATGGDSRAG